MIILLFLFCFIPLGSAAPARVALSRNEVQKLQNDIAQMEPFAEWIENTLREKLEELLSDRRYKLVYGNSSWPDSEDAAGPDETPEASELPWQEAENATSRPTSPIFEETNATAPAESNRTKKATGSYVVKRRSSTEATATKRVGARSWTRGTNVSEPSWSNEDANVTSSANAVDPITTMERARTDNTTEAVEYNTTTSGSDNSTEIMHVLLNNASSIVNGTGESAKKPVRGVNTTEIKLAVSPDTINSTMEVEQTTEEEENRPRNRTHLDTMKADDEESESIELPAEDDKAADAVPEPDSDNDL